MFADIIDATDGETIVEHNMHVRHPDSLAQGYWGQGRVTLAGDAAHPLRPASGMHLGLNPSRRNSSRMPFGMQAFLAHYHVAGTHAQLLTLSPIHSISPATHMFTHWLHQHIHPLAV